MIFQTDVITRDVRVCIDMNRSGDALFEEGDLDTLSLDEIIRSKIEDGVRIVHMQAQNYMLSGGYNFGDAVYWGDMESGWVLLPDDFMRLVVFEMSDWAQAVYQAISTDDPLYERQRSRVKAIRGTAERPVCAIGIRPEGRVLEFYSCRSEDATVRRAVYLPYPKVDECGGIDISERCYRAVVYAVAGLVLVAIGEAERGNALSEMAQGMLK